MKRLLIAVLLGALASSTAGPQASSPAELRGGADAARPAAETTALRGDDGCVSCHNGIEPMHISAAVKLSCVDCHGGNGTTKNKNEAHVAPRNPDIWKTTANPPRTYTALLRESPEFVRFINPGDLRVAPEVCGRCHPSQVNAVPRSTMTTAAIFWEAVSYANGIVSRKPG